MTDKPDLLADYELELEWARRHGITARTSARYRSEPNGLPYMIWGGRCYIHNPGAAEYMARRMRRPNPRRVA